MKNQPLYLLLLFMLSCGTRIPDMKKVQEKISNNQILSDEELSQCFKVLKDSSNLKIKTDALLLTATLNSNISYANEIYRSYFNAKSSIEVSDSEYVYHWVEINKASKNYNEIFESTFTLYRFLKDNIKSDSGCYLVRDLTYLASMSKNSANQVKSMLVDARCMIRQNKTTQAYKLLLDALYYSRKEKLSDEQDILNEIYYLCLSINRPDKARDYKLQHLKAFLDYKSIDSSEYYTILSELSDSYFDENKGAKGTEYSDKVLDYAMRTHSRGLVYRQFSILRSYLVERNNLSELYNLYAVKYPNEMDSLRKHEYPKYLRTKALLCAYKNEDDSVQHFINLTKTPTNYEAMNRFEKASFYNRTGTYYLGRGDIAKACNEFDSSFHYSEQVQYLPFMLNSAIALDSLYFKLGDLQNAYKYKSKILQIKEKANVAQRNEDFVLLEMDNAEKERTRLLDEEAEAINKKNNLQYMAIVLLIPVFFLLLFFSSSYKVPKSLIRFFGYINVIFLFEFIILLADHKIHHMTHGAPIPILAIKIVLIAILLPIHHWVEHKIVHYVLHNRIIESISIKDKLRNFYKWMAGKLSEIRSGG